MTSANRVTSIQLVVMILLGMVMLPFFGAVPASAQSQIVTSDQIQDSYLTVSTLMYKDTGELDTSYDYYSLRVTVDDRQNRGPYSVRVRIYVPSYAVEVPTNHQPQAGTFGERWTTFTYLGISYPLYLGGLVTDYTTGTTSSKAILRYFEWFQHQDWASYCPSNIFTDYGEYSVGVRVPAGASLFAYTKVSVEWSTFWLCNDGSPTWDWLHWSFVTYSSAGGADNFRSTSVRGVADAPDSGSQLTMASSQVSGIIGGLTGQGDTAADNIDRYQRGVAGGYTLAVKLYVNGQNLDLCLETPSGDRCSRKSGATDEYVEYYNPYGSPIRYINIRVINADGPIPVNAYEVAYFIAHR